MGLWHIHFSFIGSFFDVLRGVLNYKRSVYGGGALISGEALWSMGPPFMEPLDKGLIEIETLH